MEPCRPSRTERFIAMKNTTKALLAGMLLGTVMLAGCAANGAEIETVSPQAAATVIAEETDEIIIDIRTAPEFANGIIEGAINIDFYSPTFADDLNALDKDVHYVIYCRSGNRTGQSLRTFSELGFTQVTDVGGGIVNWSNAGLPVVLP